MSPVIVALDYATQEDALAMAALLDPALCRVKVGKELFTSSGPAVVESLQAKGFEVFLDLKFHDIPSTVVKAVSAAAKMNVWMVNVHASGGEKMMRDAKDMLDKAGADTLLIAVTVLTSFSQNNLQQIGVDRTVEEQVLYLAQLTKSAGLDGVVCSPLEAAKLKAALGPEFLLVTPGIRQNAMQQGDDQQRVMTASAAVAQGSDYVVVGRPVTQATDPGRALAELVSSIQ